MDIIIRNVDDLRGEILRLKVIEKEQNIALKSRFSSPSAVFHSVFSLFPKSPQGSVAGGLLNQDFFGLISRIVLPLTLNKTLFKNSNFLVKAVVGFLSQKASHFISEDSVVSVWDKVKSMFEKKPKEDHDTHQHHDAVHQPIKPRPGAAY